MRAMNLRAAVDLCRDTFRDWQEDKASRLAAALAYYAAFAIAPLLLLAVGVAGLVFGEEAARGQLFGQLQGLLGPEAAGLLETTVARSGEAGAGGIAAGVGLAVLMWSASNLFAQLQDALNTIWEVAPRPGAGILAAAKKRLLSMSLVLGTGFLLLISLVLSAAVTALSAILRGFLPGGEGLWQVINFVLTYAVVTVLFAAIYKVLPDAEVAWGDVWIGAAATALLLVIGKQVIGIYLGHASVGAAFGAAGALLVLLVWVYYAAQLLFLGAEFTQAYARRYGSRIVPEPHAVPLTEEARAQQGIPRADQVETAARDQARAPATGAPAPGRRQEGRQEGRQARRPRR
ncbi:MAG TPA: YihY/virulence factor BrkB family protein [Chloroflexota bacterium]|nr:YihY/virulence factor BrkB family protein [Chloroflexota bacterium]